MKPIETSADQFISCPIYASKNPDFPIRVTQRAIDCWAGKISILGFLRSIDRVHVVWNEATDYPVVKINDAFMPFVETYQKIKGLRVAIIKKEAELLQGAILDYGDWPLSGVSAEVWMPPGAMRGVASHPGGLKLSLERLGELQPELTGPPPFFWKTLMNKGSAEGQGYLQDYLSRCIYIGDTRATIVMKCQPLIVACYVGDFDTVVLHRFRDEFAACAIERLKLEVGSRLVATHTFYSGSDLPGDLDTSNNPPHNPWTNVSSNIGEFLSDDSQRLRELHRGIKEEEWQRCEQLGRLRMENNFPCRDGRPILSMISHERMTNLKYPYGDLVPSHYELEK